jgi:hypothetical protein
MGLPPIPPRPFSLLLEGVAGDAVTALDSVLTGLRGTYALDLELAGGDGARLFLVDGLVVGAEAAEASPIAALRRVFDEELVEALVVERVVRAALLSMALDEPPPPVASMRQLLHDSFRRAAEVCGRGAYTREELERWLDRLEASLTITPGARGRRL